MCGICGVIALEGDLSPDVREAIRPMTRTLGHRGPDGEGYFVDPAAALGHRRLAIIDREGGAQPMTSETAATWIVFNGEIYNHRELRRRLADLGHIFRTGSDTEVILHAYEEYGVECVSRLEGMFAFGIYDRINRELFLARDRLGKKPLFYAVLDGALHFASEMKAFYRSPVWDGAIDRSALEGYLSLGYILAPRTIYRSVSKLEPGHWLLARGGRISVSKYWDIEAFDDEDESTAALEAKLTETLGQAVRDRLESEVPLGAFLSGGIDSGLVVSFMADALRGAGGVRTTTVGFGGGGHNELEAAALTARHCRTRHVSEVVDPNLDRVLDAVVDAFDEPFADASAIPTYYVSAAARRQVTVALSGDGGDETFGGYGFRYIPHAVECGVRRALPGRRGRWAAARLGAKWPRGPRVPRALRWGTLLDNLGVGAAGAYFADLCFVKPAAARALLGLRPIRDVRESSVYDAVTAPYRRCPSRSAVQRAQYADLKTYLPNDVLVKVDRMSMAHSLEVRCPLLDRRLVELAFRIPRSRKMPWLRPKHLLRRVARRRLPEALLGLPKHGFTAPVGDWMAGQSREAFAADVLATASFAASELDVDRVRALLDAHSRREADHSSALWTIWMLERWSRRRPRVSRESPVCEALA